MSGEQQSSSWKNEKKCSTKVAILIDYENGEEYFFVALSK